MAFVDARQEPNIFSYFGFSSLLNLQGLFIFGGIINNLSKITAFCKIIFTNSSSEGKNLKLLSTTTLS
jgi:hypothetical protein